MTDFDDMASFEALDDLTERFAALESADTLAFQARAAAAVAADEQGFVTADGWVMAIQPGDDHPELTQVQPDQPVGDVCFAVRWGYDFDPFTGQRRYGWRKFGYWRNQTAAPGMRWRPTTGNLVGPVHTARQIEEWIAWAWTAPTMADTPIEWVEKGGSATRTPPKS